MHLLGLCAAAPFTCFYVCLILFFILFCLQLFACIPARCSKIYQQDFQRFQCNHLRPKNYLVKLPIWCFHRCWNLWKDFHFLWEFYYPWSLDLRKVTEKLPTRRTLSLNLNQLKLQLSKFSLFLNLFSWSFPCFWYLLSINFGFKKFVRKLMITLLVQNKHVNWVIVYYFTYLPFFFVLIELKLCSMPLARITTRPLTILFH